MITWQEFFQEYIGKSFFLNEKWENSVSLQLFTDAAGRTVLELCECLGQNIAILEFYPIVLSLML